MRQVDRSEPPLGVAKMDRVRERFGWSDHDLADALGVDWSQVSMYRVYGVPDRHVSRLRRLAQMSLEEVRDTSAAHAAGGERDAAVAQPVVVTTGALGGRASRGDRIVVPRTGRPKLNGRSGWGRAGTRHPGDLGLRTQSKSVLAQPRVFASPE